MFRLLRLILRLFPRVLRSRRDLLDHVLALNERHLKRLLSDYVRYNHKDKTHLRLNKQTPLVRPMASEESSLHAGLTPRGQLPSIIKG